MIFKTHADKCFRCRSDSLIARVVSAVIAIFLLSNSHVTAQKTWPPVVYVVDFANSDLNLKAVSVIRTCCEEQAKAIVVNPSDLGCPNRLTTCEFLRLDSDNSGYMIQNEYHPKDPTHEFMMAKRVRFGARDDAGRQAEIMKALRALVMCHDLRAHRGTADPKNPEPYCQRCGGVVAPPEIPKRQTVEARH